MISTYGHHVATSMALLLTLMSAAFLFFYFRPMFKWRKALKKEITILSSHMNQSPPDRAEALSIVYEQCVKVFEGRGPFNDQADIERFFTEYIRTIALCFRKNSIDPLYHVTFFEILRPVDNMQSRYDLIMKRPGFSMISKYRLSHVKHLLDIRKRLTGPGEHENPSLKSILFLIRHVRTVYLIKYLATDLLMFTGYHAVSVYGGGHLESEFQEPSIRDTLEELSRMEQPTEWGYPDHIVKIRESLLGMPGVLWKDLDVLSLKKAVYDAAHLISSHYFPSSVAPLYEVQIGAVLARGRELMASLCSKKNYSMTGKLLHIRLGTLIHAKSISDVLIPSKMKDILVKAQKEYGWLKWPLKVYLMAGKGVLWKMAADAGWFAGRKVILVMMFGTVFDKAVQEMNETCRLSSEEG